MGIFKYPYTDLHELNLDMILHMIKELDHEMDDFVAANKITNAGAWDITKQYQAWTIVSDNNAGYISLRPVPAGISISNTEYWGLIADYDILITDLSNRISALEYDMNIAQADILTLQNDMAMVKNLKLYAISDSYGTTYPDGGGYTFFDTLAEFIPDITSFAYSGDGFVNSSGGATFLQAFSADTASVTPEDAAKVDIILVAAGRNDYPYTYNQILSAIGDFVDYCNTKFPNARVLLGFIANGDNSSHGTVAQQYIVYEAYHDCAKEGAIYLEGLEAVLKIPGTMATDETHPNANGRKYLGYYIAQALICGKASVNYDMQPVNFPTISGVSLISGASNMKQEMKNGLVHIWQDGVGVVSFDYNMMPVSGGGTNIVTLGQITSGILRYPLYNTILWQGYLPITQWIDSQTRSSVQSDKIYGRIYVDPDGNVKIHVYGVDTVNVAYIYTPGFDISIPAVNC